MFRNRMEMSISFFNLYISIVTSEEVVFSQEWNRKNERMRSNECDQILKEYFTIWLKNLQPTAFVDPLRT